MKYVVVGLVALFALVLALAGGSSRHRARKRPGRLLATGTPARGFVLHFDRTGRLRGMVGLCVLLGCTIWLVAIPAFGDDAPVARAQSLFDKGRALMAEGDYARACQAFTESQRLDAGAGTLLNLALCHEKEGKLTAAWKEFNESLSAALRDGRKDREELAREQIEALRHELPHLRIVLPEHQSPDTVVRLDGTVVKSEDLGDPVPIDPGSHTLNVSAPGHHDWRTKISMVGGEQRTVKVPELVAVYPEPRSVPVLAAQQWTRSRARRERTRLAVGSYVSAGVAVAAFATAIATGLMALSAQRSARSKCLPDHNYCPDPSYVDDASRARTFAWVSTGALGLGIIASTAALAWPRQIVPTVGEHRAGLVFNGRF